jgi:zinc D-Ala-D-Ala carboxypeptidase
MRRVGFPPNFSLAELTRSERAIREGIPNVPTSLHEQALSGVAWAILQPLRDHFGVPIKVTSGYRSPKLNAATPGSSVTSQHSKGEAVDIVGTNGVSNADLFHRIRLALPFDQLILEFPDDKGEPQWVHVSYSATKRRGIILRAIKRHGKTVYEKWTP